MVRTLSSVSPYVCTIVTPYCLCLYVCIVSGYHSVLIYGVCPHNLLLVGIGESDFDAQSDRLLSILCLSRTTGLRVQPKAD